MPLFAEKKVRSRLSHREEVSFKRQILRGVLRFLGIVIVVWVTYYITRLPVFTLADLTIEGGETISHNDIRARVEDELKGSYLLLVPKRFVYLYPHDRIQEVVEKTQRIHNVHVVPTSRTTLSISFDEYVPHALWCTEVDEHRVCYFIDREGYAFAEAPQLKGGSLTRHIIEGLEKISEGTVIDPSVLKGIDTFITRAEQELGFRITSLVHKKNKDLEFNINGGGMILIASGKDLTVTFENLKSVLSSPEFKHIAPGNFKYIDVRFDNKVFVNEELETETTGTTTESVAELPE